MKGRVLAISGSDSGGGAGVQADVKVVTALGGYAATAITALTAQDTQNVYGIHEVPPAFVRQQIDVVLDDIGADCIKIGMLHRVDVLEVVTQALTEKAADIPLVADPVMVAKGGIKLLEDDTIETLKSHLLPLATILTPNVPEAEILADMSIRDEKDLQTAGQKLLAMGPGAVLMKGGHMSGPIVRNLLISATETEIFETDRIDTANTHGTGCSLAAAIATGIAQGMALRDAVARANAYVHQAILSAPAIGTGHGPLNHAHTVRPFGQPAD